MKIIFQIFLISIIALSSCLNNSTSKINSSETKSIHTKDKELTSKDTDVKTSIDKEQSELKPTSNKIDIKKELQEEWGYIMRLNDSILSFTNHQELYNPFLSFDSAEFQHILKGYSSKIDSNTYNYDVIFHKGQSTINIATWKSEYSDNYEVYLGEGQLVDKSIVLPIGINVGMLKSNFLKEFFIVSKDLEKNIKLIQVYQDERGETYTEYQFDLEKLSVIKFGCHESYHQ